MWLNRVIHGNIDDEGFRIFIEHYSDVTMNVMASQITAYGLFAQSFVQVHIKENIKAPRQWPL